VISCVSSTPSIVHLYYKQTLMNVMLTRTTAVSCNEHNVYSAYTRTHTCVHTHARTHTRTPFIIIPILIIKSRTKSFAYFALLGPFRSMDCISTFHNYIIFIYLYVVSASKHVLVLSFNVIPVRMKVRNDVSAILLAT
jgi:hypothetical protein